MNEINLLSRMNKKYPPLVLNAILLIETQYAFLYGIDDLAEQLEVTKPHLIRTFQAAAGISPGKYLTYIRLENAKVMLRSGKGTPLELVAGACGYSCANYFAKAFKKHTLMTPSEYANSFPDSTADLNTDLLIQKMYL